MSYQTPIELFNIIDTIVDYIRVTGSITASSEVSGTYTLTTVNTLANNDYITIDSISYKVSNVTGTSFTIKDATGLDFTNQTWKANAPYFMHEKEAKAGAVLNEKTKQDNYKWQKYPLILLIHPYTQVQDSRDYSYSSTFQLILITNTEQSDWSDDRYDNNITPILRPIQESLINALATSVYTRVNNAYDIDYEWTDLLYIDGNPFPDKMDGVMLDVNSLEILEVQACVTTTQQTFNLILSSGDGGSTDPVEGTYTFNKGDITAVYGQADAGFKFDKWLVNTIELLDNPLALTMNQNKDVLAQFIVSQIKQITIAVSGTGTTDPIPGDYDIESGDSQLITAIETDPLWYFNEWDQDGNITTANPQSFTVIENSLVVAYFIEFLQVVFGDAPQKVDNLHYWINQTSGNLPVQIKQNQMLNTSDGFARVVYNASSNNNITDGFELDIFFKFNTLTNGIFQTIISKRDSDTEGTWSFSKGNDNLLWFFYYANGGFHILKSNFTPVDSVFYLGTVTVSGGNITYTVIGLNGDSYTTTVSFIEPLAQLSSKVALANRGGAGLLEHGDISLDRVCINNYADSHFKESSGTEIINRIVGGDNGTLIGANEIQAWSIKSDEAESLEKYPYTLFQQIADPTIFYRAIYDTDNNPTVTSKTGYNKIAEVPANVMSNTGAIYDGIQITGLDDATFDEVLAIEDSATVDITKDANTVSLLKIK